MRVHTSHHRTIGVRECHDLSHGGQPSGAKPIRKRVLVKCELEKRIWCAAMYYFCEILNNANKYIAYHHCYNENCLCGVGLLPAECGVMPYRTVSAQISPYQKCTFGNGWHKSFFSIPV